MKSFVNLKRGEHAIILSTRNACAHNRRVGAGAGGQGGREAGGQGGRGAGRQGTGGRGAGGRGSWGQGGKGQGGRAAGGTRAPPFFTMWVGRALYFCDITRF